MGIEKPDAGALHCQDTMPNPLCGGQRGCGAVGGWRGLVCVHKGDGEGAEGCASGQRAVILTLTPFQNVFH